MAGALGRLDLMPPASIDDVREQLSTAYEDAMKELTKQGIRPGGAPSSGYEGEMPADLTSLDDEQVGNLLNNLSGWCGFLDVELAKADSEYNESQKVLNTLKRNIRIWFKTDPDGHRLTGPDKDDRVDNDPRVVMADRHDLMCYTKYKVLKAMNQQAQRNWETVSRRITMLGQQIQRAKREMNVAGTPLQGRTFLRGPPRFSR
jgi:hypothetical protein